LTVRFIARTLSCIMRLVLSIESVDHALDGARPGCAGILLSRKKVSQVSEKMDPQESQALKPWGPGILLKRMREPLSETVEPLNSIETGLRESRDGYGDPSLHTLDGFTFHLTSIRGNDRSSRQASSFIGFSRVEQHGVGSTGRQSLIGWIPCGDVQTEMTKILPSQNATAHYLTKSVRRAQLYSALSFN
jgi:hypothetical protein